MRNALHRGSAGGGACPRTYPRISANTGTGASLCAPLVTDDLDTALVQRCGLSCAGFGKVKKGAGEKILDMFAQSMFND